MTAALNRLRDNTALIGVLVLAFAMRVMNLGYGLPYFYADEPVFVGPTIYMLSSLDPNPHWFGHPGHFLMYLLAGWFILVSLGVLAFRFLTGHIHGPADVSALFSAETYREVLRPVYYLSGRFLMVLLALLAILLTYRIGKRFFGKPAALLAGLTLAVSPMLVAGGRFIRTDIPGVVLIVLSQFFLLNFIEEKKNKWLIAASLTAGFAIADKYTLGLFMLLILAYAVEDGLKRRKAAVNLLTVLAFTFIGFFVFAPFVLLDFKHAIADILLETETTHLGADRLPGLQNYYWYFKYGVYDAVGGAFFMAFAAVGLIPVCLKGDFKKRFFLVFPLVYFFVMASASIRFQNRLMPVLPFVAVLFGAGVHGTHRFISGRIRPRAAARAVLIVFWVLTFAALVSVAVRDYRYAETFSRTDSRTIAKEWIESHLPAGSKIAYEDYAPQMQVNPKRPFVLLDRGYDKIVSLPLSAYEEQSVDYIIITDSFRSRFFEEPKKYGLEIQRYKELVKKTELVKVFSYPDHPGPVIRIYRLKGTTG